MEIKNEVWDRLLSELTAESHLKVIKLLRETNNAPIDLNEHPEINVGVIKSLNSRMRKLKFNLTARPKEKPRRPQVAPGQKRPIIFQDMMYNHLCLMPDPSYDSGVAQEGVTGD